MNSKVQANNICMVESRTQERASTGEIVVVALKNLNIYTILNKWPIVKQSLQILHLEKQ